MRLKKFLKELQMEEVKKFSSCTVQTCDIPDILIDVIKGIQNSIPSDKVCTDEDEEGWVQNGLQQLFHITILYGIKPEALETVRDSFVTPFSIKTDKIHYFDSEEKGYSVAVLKCDSKDLTDFHHLLKGQLENKHSFDYIPHITVAYLKLGERLDLADWAINCSWNCGGVEMSMADGTIEKININN